MVYNPPGSPLNYPANNTTPVRIFSYDRAPTSADYQNFKIRDFWIDSSSDDLWFLVDKGAGVSTWILLGGTNAAIETVTGNTGGAVSPDASNNLNLLGSAPITVTGNPATNTLTIDTDGTVAESYPTDAGTAIPAAGVLNVLGGTGIDTAGAGSTVSINASGNVATTYTTDDGNTATPSSNNLNVFGNGTIFTTSSGATVSVNSYSNFPSANLGITYSGGTFSITSSSGSALSSSNPGSIQIGSKTTPGTNINIPITANQTFDDATGTSTIIGNLFGLTTGIAHADDIPFFIYAVLNDNEDDIAFMISRYPFARSSPVNTKIGQSGSAVADSQGSFFSLKSITATEWDQNPCVPIGSFRMTMDSSDDWTVTTLGNTDGINHFQRNQGFIMSLGQFGAKASNWFIDNGGTAPTVGGGALSYYIVENQIFCKFSADFSGNGVGAVSLTLKTPFISADGLNVPAPVMITAAAAPTFIGTTALNVFTNDVTFYATNPTNIRILLNTDAVNTQSIYAAMLITPYFS